MPLKKNSSLRPPKQITVTSTPYSVTDEDILLVDPGAVGADIEIDLPPSATRYNDNIKSAKDLTVMNMHHLNDVRVNINSDGIEEINEVLTIQLKRRESATISPDGKDWWIIST